MREKTSCTEINTKQGNLINSSTNWNLTAELVTMTDVPLEELKCHKRTEKINAFLPIPELTHSEAEDLCHKFGENVPIGGNFEDKAGFDAYYEGLLANGKFVSVCGFYDNSRLKTWLPYKHNSERSLLVHQGTGLALLPNQTDK